MFLSYVVKWNSAHQLTAAKTIGQGEGGTLADLWHIVDLVEDRVDALAELVRAAREAPESVRRAHRI